MTAPNPKGSSGGNTFSRKVGPLPMWAWLLIGVALLVVVYTWKKNQTANTSSSTDATTTSSDQIPQYVNQTYVQNFPPGTPSTTPSTPSNPSSPGPTSNNGGTAPDKLPASYKYGYMKTSAGMNTLADIAKHFGVSQATILALNPGIEEKHWNINSLPEGQTLRIPTGSSAHTNLIRTGGQWSTIPRIARHFGVTAQQLIAANPQIGKNGWDVHNLPPGEVLVVPGKGAA